MNQIREREARKAAGAYANFGKERSNTLSPVDAKSQSYFKKAYLSHL